MQTEIEKLINNLLQEYRLDNFRASPEPGHRREHADGDAEYSALPSVATHAGPDAHHPATQPTAPAPPPPQEGYMPTGFGDVTVSKPMRPLGGRYPTKRRR
jgi:hypothetical protein